MSAGRSFQWTRLKRRKSAGCLAPDTLGTAVRAPRRTLLAERNKNDKLWPHWSTQVFHKRTYDPHRLSPDVGVGRPAPNALRTPTVLLYVPRRPSLWSKKQKRYNVGRPAPKNTLSHVEPCSAKTMTAKVMFVGVRYDLMQGVPHRIACMPPLTKTAPEGRGRSETPGHPWGVVSGSP